MNNDNKALLSFTIDKAIKAEDKRLEEFLNHINNNTAPLHEFMSRYKCAIMEIETKFKVLNERFSIRYDENPIEHISSRVKSLDSIMRKVIRKKISPTFESIEKNILDIAGVRVICSFEQDVYKMADYLLKQDDIKLLKKKDYIAKPKENGYRSLHLIVTVPIFTEKGKMEIPVEVQLRTIAMDFWASLEHKIRYKKNIPEELRDELSSCLYSCAEKSNQLDKEFQSISDKAKNASKT